MKLLNIPLIALSLALAMSCGHNSAPHHDHEDEHNHEAEAHNHELVELSREQIETVGIQFGELSRVRLGVTFRASGELAVDPQHEATAAPLMAGIVKRILVREGDKVAKGQAVAYIENAEVISLQHDYLAAKQEETLARQELERQNALAAAGAGIRKNQQQAATAAQLAATKTSMIAKQLAIYGVAAAKVSPDQIQTVVPLSAPIAGTVAQVLGTVGSYADAQAPLLKIVNNAAVYARLNIFEKNLADIAVGQQVELRLTNRPDISLSGEVVSITPAIESSSKALAARVKIIGEKPLNLVPDMPVSAVITADNSEVDALPDEAIVSAEGKSYVFVLSSQQNTTSPQQSDTSPQQNATSPQRSATKQSLGLFRRVEVITGVKERGYTEVKFLAPIDTAAQFVVKNAFYLGSMTTEHAEHSH